MKLGLIALIIVSVVLTSAAQILLKLGMSSPAVQLALKGGVLGDTMWAVATSIAVLGGLAMFALSVVLWLLVLSRVDVSFAYPFVALGMVLTVLSGRLLLGEPLTMLRLGGLALIVIGVILVAMSNPAPPASAQADPEPLQEGQRHQP